MRKEEGSRRERRKTGSKKGKNEVVEGEEARDREGKGAEKEERGSIGKGKRKKKRHRREAKDQ